MKNNRYIFLLTIILLNRCYPFADDQDNPEIINSTLQNSDKKSYSEDENDTETVETESEEATPKDDDYREILATLDFVEKHSKSRGDFCYFICKYLDVNGKIKEVFVEVPLLEILKAMQESCGGNLYRCGISAIETLDTTIKSKKAILYLVNNAILKNDEKLKTQILEDINYATKQARGGLFDQYILSLCEEDFQKIDTSESRQETFYYFSYVIVNTKKIAESIVDFVKTNDLIKKNLKDSFKQASEQYGSIKKMPIDENNPEYDLTIDEITNIFGTEKANEFESAEEKTILSPIELNNGKYIVVFIDQKIQKSLPEERIKTLVKSKIIQQKSKEVIENKFLELKDDIFINQNVEHKLTDVAIQINDPRVHNIVTFADLYNITDENEIEKIDYNARQNFLEIALNSRLSDIIKQIICLDENLEEKFPNDFIAQRNHLLNKKFMQRLQEYSHSVTVTDEELITLYPDEIKRKRVQGLFLYIEHKPLFNDIYINLSNDINKISNFEEKQAKFVEIASKYTTRTYIKNDLTIANLKKISEKWLDSMGNIIDPENFECGMYMSNVSNLGIILFVKSIYTEDLNQQLLDELRKKHGDEKMKQMLLCISMIPFKPEINNS